MRVQFTHIAIYDTLTVEKFLGTHSNFKAADFPAYWREYALTQGAEAFIIRDSAKDEFYFNTAFQYLRLHKPSTIPLICNHRSQMLLPDSDGVHYKRGSTRRAGEEKVYAGVSAHSAEGVRNAERNGFDYVFISPVFATQSHPGEKGLGLEKLSRICVSVHIPVFALGGITSQNRASCFVAGVKGTASISMFMPPGNSDIP